MLHLKNSFVQNSGLAPEFLFYLPIHAPNGHVADGMPADIRARRGAICGGAIKVLFAMAERQPWRCFCLSWRLILRPCSRSSAIESRGCEREISVAFPMNPLTLMPLLLSMEVWKKILSYLSLKKQAGPADGSHGFNLRAMHTINKISIFMFLVGLVILVVKMLT